MLIDIHVAHANAAGDHRDGGVLAAELVQRATAAWDDHVHICVELQQLLD